MQKILITIAFVLTSQLVFSQQELIGKWKLSGLIIRERESSIKDENHSLTLRSDGTYVRSHHVYPGGVKYSFSKSFASTKVTISDQNGKPVKSKRTKEKGTYTVEEGIIKFAPENGEGYDVPYDLSSTKLTFIVPTTVLASGKYTEIFSRR